ncbi:hypothetical protein Bbelb_397020, partial [Branchiostoma belcheri]
ISLSAMTGCLKNEATSRFRKFYTWRPGNSWTASVVCFVRTRTQCSTINTCGHLPLCHLK